MAASVAGAGGLHDRGSLDATPEVGRFAATLGRVCVETVEGGDMTKDLALLISPEQTWLTTEQFMAKLDANLRRAMG